ncbi:hypothetical protein PIB30_040591 [Stylosanthes scabra]|uniref:Uncharacterized protein n=1 Tax=Stylosanthes scabra TaxID=79078 RepID=A0ABU6ZDD2_9FABA|nr:hypothetical protein [Stylosanthes scabra]
MQGRTELSSVQPLDVYKKNLSTGSARDYSRSRADMNDSDSGDPNYNPVADKVDSWEDHLDNLFKREEIENRDTKVRRRDTDNWKVSVIENGVMRPQNITMRQVFSMPAGRQVVLPLNSALQAIGNAGGLLSTVLGIMVIDFAAFPVHVRSWKHMTKFKERECDRQIKACLCSCVCFRSCNILLTILYFLLQRYFPFEVEDKKAVKKVILAKLGKIWKDIRGIFFRSSMMKQRA